ncbi:MAG: hypothetical protein GWP59_02645 [Chlamydiales bacterium]|nr:hypothetical protein [Chlamydiales bacterium]
MKRVAIVFQDIGASLQLIPISMGLHVEGLQILNLCSSRCAPILESRGLRYKQVLKREDALDLSTRLNEELSSFQPDIILIGNSAQKDNLDHLVLELSKSLDIPCCQFVDFWGEIRVSPPFPDSYITFDEIGYYSLRQRDLTPVYCVESPKHYEYCKLDLAALKRLFFMKFPQLSSKIITSVFLQSEKYLPGHLDTILEFANKIKERIKDKQHKLLIKSHPSYPEDFRLLQHKMLEAGIDFLDVSDVPLEEVFSVTRYAASCLSTCTVDFRYFCEYLGHEGTAIFLTFHPLIKKWLDRLGLKHRKKQKQLNQNFYFLDDLEELETSRHIPITKKANTMHRKVKMPVTQVYEVLERFLKERRYHEKKYPFHLV